MQLNWQQISNKSFLEWNLFSEKHLRVDELKEGKKNKESKKSKKSKDSKEDEKDEEINYEEEYNYPEDEDEDVYEDDVSTTGNGNKVKPSKGKVLSL